MFLLLLQHVTCFSHHEYLILIPPAVRVYNHTWPTTEPVFLVFCIFIQALQLRATSEQRDQTSVRPPGHQWSGTNHQSEWLLMELEQLPQTIKKGQKDINSNVLKGGVGGLRGFVSARPHPPLFDSAY